MDIKRRLNTFIIALFSLIMLAVTSFLASAEVITYDYDNAGRVKKITYYDLRCQKRMKTASYTDGTGSHLLQYAFGRNNVLAEMKKSDNSILTSTITYLNDGANRS